MTTVDTSRSWFSLAPSPLQYDPVTAEDESTGDEGVTAAMHALPFLLALVEYDPAIDWHLLSLQTVYWVWRSTFTNPPLVIAFMVALD